MRATSRWSTTGGGASPPQRDPRAVRRRNGLDHLPRDDFQRPLRSSRECAPRHPEPFGDGAYPATVAHARGSARGSPPDISRQIACVCGRRPSTTLRQSWPRVSASRTLARSQCSSADEGRRKAPGFRVDLDRFDPLVRVRQQAPARERHDPPFVILLFERQRAVHHRQASGRESAVASEGATPSRGSVQGLTSSGAAASTLSCPQARIAMSAASGGPVVDRYSLSLGRRARRAPRHG